MKFKYSQKGVSLVLTFFIMSIILATVFGASTILFKKIGMVKDIKDSMAVFYITNSGIEKTLYFDRKVLPEGICNICDDCLDCEDCTSSGTDCGSSCTDCTISYYTEFDGEKYEIEATVVQTNGFLETTIKSSGSYKEATRAIELIFTRPAPTPTPPPD